MVDIAFGPEPGKRPDPSAPGHAVMQAIRRRRLYGGLLLVIFVAVMASGFQVAQDRNAGDFLEGLSRLDDFPREVLSEAWANRANLPRLMWEHLPSLVETINIAAVSTLFGALTAALLALFLTRGLAPFPRLIGLLRRITDALRAVPEIVIALVLIFIFGSGPIPAVIAITIHTIGVLGKLFSEVAENADLKPVDGLASVGATWGKRMWFGILPQVAPNWFSYALLRFEINVRASAILGFVGSGGIGYDLKIAMQWGAGKYDQVVAIFIILFLTIVLIDRLSDRVRRKLTHGDAQ